MRSLLAITLLLGACADPESACERAADHVAACFPDHAVAATCDPASAEQIANESCDQLAGHDGKADGWTCVWMPWLCTGDGGSSSGKRVEVAVEECGGMADDLCPYVQSASCGLVTLHDSHGHEVARGYSNENGRLTFEGLSAGSYTAKVHARDGSIPTMETGDFSSGRGKAEVTVEVGSGEAPWARFELVPGSEDRINACAVLDGNLTVKSAHGTALDRKEVEWDWLVELESDGKIERTRPLFLSSPDRNVMRFGLIHTGDHTLRFVRMDIPSYARKPNPDYDRLRDLYSTSEPPIEVSVHTSTSSANKTVDISRTIVDPLAN